jgi:energy-coupling factor transporter ATP-binding protein EcfA2
VASLSLKRFANELLEPFDLALASSECITLSGPSGSGKSRLLRAIADLEPHQGEAFIEQSPQSSMSGPQWRKRVGLLPAEVFWWSERVAEHFAQLDETLLQALGFGREVGDWESARLSSGERQRLGLARLLANQPEVLLLDEPTANLDRDNTQRVEALIRDWQSQQGIGVIWVSHDREQQARIAKRHYRITDRQLRADTAWT